MPYHDPHFISIPVPPLAELSLSELLDFSEFESSDIASGELALIRGDLLPLVFYQAKERLDADFLVTGTGCQIFGKHTVKIAVKEEEWEVLCSCARWARVSSCSHAACILEALFYTLDFSDDSLEEVPNAVRDAIFESRKSHQEICGAKPPTEDSATGKLNGLILYLDASCGIDGESAPSLRFSESLPKHRRLPTRQLLLKSELGKPLVSRIPASFKTSPRKLQPQYPYSAYSERAINEELSCSIGYVFEDKQIVYVNEILYDPRAKLLPVELLPLTPKNGFGPARRGFSLNTKPSWWRDSEVENLAALAVVSVLENTKKLDVPVWVTFDKQADKDRPVFLAEKIKFIDEADFIYQVKLGDDEIVEGEIKVNVQCLAAEVPSGTVWYKHFGIHLESRTLFFHSFPDAFNHLLNLTITEKYLPNLFECFLSSGIETTGNRSITALLSKLESGKKMGGPDYLFLATREHFKVENLNPRIWIHENGDFSFSFETEKEPNEKWRFWNLPSNFEPLIRFLTEGLSGFFQVESRDIAHRSNRYKREFDLKLLRHIGVATLSVQRFLDMVKEKDPNAPINLKKRQSVLASLKQEIVQLLLLKNRMEPVSAGPRALEKICSQKVSKLIDDAFEAFTAIFHSKETVYVPSSEINLDDSGQVVFAVVGALLSAAFQENGLKLISKQRNSPLDVLSFQKGNLANRIVRERVPVAETPELLPYPIANRYPLPVSKASADLTISTFLPLVSNGFEIFYEGKKLNFLAPDDFNFSISLEEKSNPDSAEGLLANGKINWFELHPKFFFKGVEIPASAAKNLYKTGVLEFQGRFYHLRDRKIKGFESLASFWQGLQTSAAGKKNRLDKATIYALPYHRVLEMLALRAIGVPVNGGKFWEEICKFYDSLGDNREKLKLPPTFTATLKNYQETGVQWLHDLYRLRLGGILADDMGLGKTIQVLAFLEFLRARNEMGRVLVVVPTSLTYNWKSEAARFTPSLATEIFRPKAAAEIQAFLEAGKNQVLIVTYGLMQEHAAFFESQPWNIVVFDEAQNLKNLVAQRTTTARKLNANFKVCVTGTPLENHLGEFYSLLDLVVPGCMGDFSAYRETYITPDTLRGEDVELLKLKTRPLVLRRTKSAILKELPEKTETTIKIPFPNDQKRLYREVALSWNAKVQESLKLHGKVKSQLAMLTALLRLRQVCSDPQGLPGVKYLPTPPKVALLLDTLSEIVESGESSIVFTQFLETFKRIENELKQRGFPTFAMSGATTRAQRERLLSEFDLHSGGAVLLMTLKTGGVGLNLVKASYVFHLEPWWNPAVENQATDRVHRLGQERPVQVYRYLMEGSVEEKIEGLKARKASRFNAVFGDTDESGDPANLVVSDSMLSQEDFNYLLT